MKEFVEKRGVRIEFARFSDAIFDGLFSNEFIEKFDYDINGDVADADYSHSWVNDFKNDKYFLECMKAGETTHLLSDKYGHENFPFKDLLNIFDYQFLSYKNGLVKPDIKCWEVIKDHYKTDYKNMVMVGDSIENDMTSAESLGLSTILVDVNKEDGIYNEIYDKLINN